MTHASAQEIVDIAQHDHAQALARFNMFSMDEQLVLIQQASPEDKKELLFLAKNLKGLFHKLSGRDVILSLEAASASEFDVLIQYAHPDHLNFLLAMGCWRNGRIDETRFLYWLEVLNNCNEYSLKQTLSDIDADFIAAAIRPFVNFPEPENYDDFDEYNHGMIDAYSLTPEDCICDNDAVAEFLDRLHSIDKSLFALICIKLVYADPQEVLDHAFRMYTQRLKQESLPSWEEASAIYKSNTAETVGQSSDSKDATETGTEISKRNENRAFLPLVLAFIRQQGNAADAAAIASDFGILLGRIAVADGTSMDAFGRNRMVRKADILCGLGLEQQSGSDIRQAANLIRSSSLPVFFNLGFNLVSSLHLRVKALADSLTTSDSENTEPAFSLRAQAILSNAEKEIPRRLLDNGNSRSIRNLDDYKAVCADIAELERGIPSTP